MESLHPAPLRDNFELGDIMKLDSWIVGRTEQVVERILVLTGQSTDLLLSIVAEAAEDNTGVLHVVGSYELFEKVESDQTVEEEARDIIAKLALAGDNPLGTIEEVATETIITWCNYFFEIIGRFQIESKKLEAKLEGGDQGGTLEESG